MTRYRDDLVWLAPPLTAGAVVYLVYLWTNPYPAHGAGLYFTMAGEVIEHGYALPRRIPYYTRGGIPFAYSPLAIYAIALVRDVTGVDPLALSRWLPGLVVIASLVPTYHLALELLSSRRAASLVATLVAANAQLLDWHLTAGGLVRAPAFLFTVVGLYAGLHHFRSGGRRWLGLSVASFGLTLLTHPTYGLFFGVSYLVLSAGYDRTPAWFTNGAVVGVGGVVMAAPWWLTVVRTHGVDVFLAAMDTRGGGGGVVAEVMGVPPDPLVVLLAALAVLGFLAGIVTGWTYLVAWLVATGLVFSQPRFTILVGTFLVVAVLRTVATRPEVSSPPSVGSRSGGPRGLANDGGRRGLGNDSSGPENGVGGPATLLAVAVILSALIGAGYIRDDTAAPRLSVTPDHIDGTDMEAMAWARSATPSNASFVVLGDAAEWFPLFAERTVLVSPWGAEWEGSYDRHTATFRAASRCYTEGCLTAALERGGVRPVYVYVPKDTHPVQGTPHHRTGELSRNLERSDRHRLIFENRGVAVFRVVQPRPDRGGQ